MNLNKILLSVASILLFLTTIAYADTNGVWHYAEDVVPGVLGLDEGASGSNKFTFINNVELNESLISNSNVTFNSQISFNDLAIFNSGLRLNSMQDANWQNVESITNMSVRRIFAQRIYDWDNISLRLDPSQDSIINTLYVDGVIGIGTRTITSGSKLEVVGGAIKATGGFILETRTSDPVSPQVGQMWLRTDLP